jgi:hypothetical protein
MSSLVQTQPRTGRRSFTLRAYLAGTAATAALLGAVVVVFASLGAYVAFNGLPIGGDQSAAAPTSVKVAPSDSAAGAKRAHRPQANATAAQQSANGGATASRGASRDSNGGAAGGGATTTGQATVSPASPAAPTGTSTATTSAGGSGTTPTSGSAPQAPSSGGGPLPTPQVTTPDSVGSTVGTVEQTLHSAGVDVPLSQAGSTVDQLTDGLSGGN